MKDIVGPEITAEQRAEVEALLRRRDLSPRGRERLERGKAGAVGQDLAALAAWSGRTVRTVKRWLRRFAQGGAGAGAGAGADAPRAGRPPLAHAAYRQALERAVDTAPRERGLPFDVWTSARLSAYLAETTGVRIAPGWLRVLLAQPLGAAGLRLRTPHTRSHTCKTLRK